MLTLAINSRLFGAVLVACGAVAAQPGLITPTAQEQADLDAIKNDPAAEGYFVFFNGVSKGDGADPGPLYKVDNGSASATKLADIARWPTIHPGGDIIAYAEPVNESKNYNVVFIDRYGGNRRVITPEPIHNINLMRWTDRNTLCVGFGDATTLGHAKDLGILDTAGNLHVVHTNFSRAGDEYGFDAVTIVQDKMFWRLGQGVVLHKFDQDSPPENQSGPWPNWLETYPNPDPTGNTPLYTWINPHKSSGAKTVYENSERFAYALGKYRCGSTMSMDGKHFVLNVGGHRYWSYIKWEDFPVPTADWRGPDDGDDWCLPTNGDSDQKCQWVVCITNGGDKEVYLCNNATGKVVRQTFTGGDWPCHKPSLWIGSSCKDESAPITGPSNLEATAAGQTAVSLSWTPAQDPDCNGIINHKVYRRKGASGEFIIAAQTAGTEAVDPELEENSEYYYYVTGINSSNLESAQSNTVSVRTAGDTQKPTLLSATARNATTIRVVFSEPLDQTSAERASNYTLSGGATIASALLKDETTVLVTTSPLTENEAYTLTVSNVTDLASAPNAIAPNTTIAVTYVESVTGWALRRYWNNLSGKTISALTGRQDYPADPHGIDTLHSLAGPENIGDHYGAEVTGYIHPPRDGDYTFYCAADDAAELWLSADESPENAIVICSNEAWTSKQDYAKYPSQKSAVQTLKAGLKYYFKLLYVEDAGEDHFSIAWESDELARTIIDGERLSNREPFTWDLTLPPLEKTIWCVGETMHIKWNPDFRGNVVVKISYDKGRNYDVISPDAIAFGDPHWADFPFVIPVDRPEVISNQVMIHIHDYDLETTVYAISEPFTIQECLQTASNNNQGMQKRSVCSSMREPASFMQDLK